MEIRKQIKKWIKKWQTMSPVAKTSFILIIAKFFQKGLAMISSPIFTRIMPRAEYGVISTFASWQSVLYIIATLNMSQGVFNNGMLEYKDDRDSFTFSILVLANACTAVYTGVYIIFYQWIVPILELPDILIWIMLLYFFVTPAYNYWLGRNRFEYKYKSILIITIMTSLFSTGGAIVMVLLAADDQKAIAKIVSTESVAIIVGFIFYLYIIYHARGRVQLSYWKYALSINLPLIPHYLSMYILSSSDRIMITKLVDTSATAIYNVAYTVAAVLLIFWNAVDAAYAPWIYQKMEEKDYQALHKRGQEVIVLFAGCTVFITLFAPEIIRLLGPEEYYEGVYVIPSVAAGVFFTAVFSLYMRVELYLKKSSTIMLATVAAALINLILNYICIPGFGYVAAGYTTLVCYILLALFHAVNLKRLGYGMVYNNKTIGVISGALCTVIISLSLLYAYTVIRYILMAVLLVIGIKNRGRLRRLIKTKGS